MESPMSGFLTNVKSRGEELLGAMLPLLKLLTIGLIGVVLAYPKTQMVPKATFRLLGKLVFAIFLPCMIFSHLGESITLRNFVLWWFIPVNVLLSTAVGCLLGLLVAKLCRPPPEFFRLTVIMTGFGNTGNLSLAIVGTICHSEDNPFGHDCHRTGVAYVSFAQWVAALLVYTLVYHMMEPPLDHFEVVEEEEGTDGLEELQVTNLSRPLLVEVEWPGMEDKETAHCKTPFIQNVFTGDSSNVEDADVDLSEGGSHGSLTSIRCLAEPPMVRRIRIVAEQTPIRHIFQPPTFATLMAFLIGMVPPFKTFVYGDDAPLSFITDSLDIMAGGMVPLVMLIIGGMLAEGPNESRLGMRTTVGIVVTRLLILPLIGIGIVTLADKLNFLIHGDQMFRFVLLLQYTTPSAILLGAVASLRGYAVGEASALLFWQHIFALFSLSMYSVVYSRLLFSFV